MFETLLLTMAVTVPATPAPNPSVPDIRKALANATMELPSQDAIAAAQAKRRAGKNKVLIGVIGMVGGTAIATLAGDDCVNDVLSASQAGRLETCSGNRATIVLGGLAATGGLAMTIWGGIQWSDANSEIARLGSGGASSTFALPIGDGQRLALTLGETRALRYQVSW